MRIVLACPYSWTRPGGVQSQVRGLADALRREGHRTTIVAPAEGPVEDGVVAAGRSIPIASNGSAVPVALSPAAIARSLRAARGADLVHLHEPMIPAVSFSLLVQEPAALVGTFHMAAPGPGWYRVFGPLARRLLGRLDARIAVSRSARDHVDAVAPAPCEIVPLGLDLPPAARRHAGDGPGRILFVGRPDPRKGLGVLLDAFARLPGTPHLDLVGVAPSAARAAAGSRGLNGRVHAYGRISDADRDALMQRADVFCSPALRSESFGLVLAEAMAAGLPVVASDVGGHADVVGRDTGALVPPGDPEATARALQGLLADPSERSRCGRAARERAQALAWDRIAARHLEIYERALRRRAGRLSAARSAATSAATQSRPAASGPAPH